MRRSGRSFLIGSLAAALVALCAAQVLAHNPRFKARLSGSAETQGGDQDGSGRATVRVNDEKRKICFTVRFEGIDPPNGAHIHKAPKGQDGDVVVPLWGTPQTSPAKGCVDAPKSVARAIQRKPGGYYINVHNETHPAGAIRGQLKAAG